MKIDFSGQVAIVTGAGGGIGRAVSLALSDVGAKVLLVDLSKESGQETESQILQRGGTALFVCADVSQAHDVEAYVKVALDTWGRIDIFMNNAAWQGEINSIVNYPVEMFDKVMGINVRGVFLGLKFVLPAMIKQGKGAVINTASLGAYIGTRNLGPYTASMPYVLVRSIQKCFDSLKQNKHRGSSVPLNCAHREQPPSLMDVMPIQQKLPT